MPLYLPPSSSGGGGSISVTDGTTTVDPATSLRLPNVVDLGGGEAGVGLVFRLIGPYAVQFDTPDLTADGVTLDTVPAGSIVLRVMVSVRETWTVDDAGGRHIDVGIGTVGLRIYVGSWWVDDDNAGAHPLSYPYAFDYVRSVAPGVDGQLQVVFTQQDQPLFARQVNIAGSSTPPTTGAADIYAIIATPAA